MFNMRLVGLVFGLVALSTSQDAEVATGSAVSTVSTIDQVGCGPKGKCPHCNKGTPLGFNFHPCPVEANFSGTVILGGDISHGRMSLSLETLVKNECGGSQPCKKAKLSVQKFKVEHIFFEKNYTTVDIPYPTVSDQCSVCDVILTYPLTPKPKPPTPPKEQCKVALDFLATIDVSKSMSTFKGTPEGTKHLISNVAHRFKLGNQHTRFAGTSFGNTASIEWPLISNAAIDRRQLNKAIYSIRFTDQFSNHAAAIDSAISQFKRQPQRRVPKVLVLFADGKPNRDIRRLYHAVKRLRCLPRLCFAIVGINTIEGSEEEMFFRSLLGAKKDGKCDELFRVRPTVQSEVQEVGKALSEWACKCASSPPKVPEPEAVTTFTVRIAGKTLPDFGTRDELNQSVDEMLYNAAEAAGVTPDRLTAIAIEDTAGNIITDDLASNAQQSAQQGDNTAPATLVEVMFDEPGLNAEIGSLEGARQLATIMTQSESSFKDRCMERGLTGLRVERIAMRQNDGLMPIIDVLQE